MMPGLETQFEETFGGTAGFALAAHARRTPSRRGRTGHKTENVYRRYAIVSEADLDEAARRLS